MKKTIDALNSRINYTMQRVTSWMNCNYLHINTEKTKAMLFGINNSSIIKINIDNNPIEIVDAMRCLGIVLDNKFSFDKHISTVNSKVNFMLKKLYSLRYSLPCKIRETVAHAFLLSVLNYGIEIYSSTNRTNFIKLSRIVNRIIRYVYDLRISEHVSSYVKSFFGYSFSAHVRFRLLLSFYKIVVTKNPPSLYEKFTFSRSNRSPQIIIPRIFSSIFDHSFLVRISRIWNCLPIYLRTFSATLPQAKLLFFHHLTLQEE